MQQTPQKYGGEESPENSPKHQGSSESPLPATMPDGASEEPLLLTLSDVARLLRISRRQVHRLLSSGRLPPADVNLGYGSRGRRWRRDLLTMWVEAGCPPADAWAAARRR